MAVTYTKPGGWKFERERPDELQRWARPLTYGAEEAPIPERYDPSGWYVVENQKAQGSCQGNALSTGVELLHAREGGNLEQLSRACAYYLSQRIDGIRGDEGSTISAGIKLAETTGICLESDWPYPERYDPRTPPGFMNFVKYLIANHSPVLSAADMITHIGLHGPVHIGIIWSEDIDRQAAENGIISRYQPGQGGHSVEFIGYRLKSWDGRPLDRPHGILANSWSTQWGHNGLALVSPQAIDAMINSRYGVFVGLYGARHPEITAPEYPEELT